MKLRGLRWANPLWGSDSYVRDLSARERQCRARVHPEGHGWGWLTGQRLWRLRCGCAWCGRGARTWSMGVSGTASVSESRAHVGFRRWWPWSWGDTIVAPSGRGTARNIQRKQHLPLWGLCVHDSYWLPQWQQLSLSSAEPATGTSVAPTCS